MFIYYSLFILYFDLLRACLPRRNAKRMANMGAPVGANLRVCPVCISPACVFAP